MPDQANKPFRTVTILALTLLVTLSSVVRASAQSQASTGQIVGVVTDPNGATVADAKVTIVSPSTGLRREVVTNAAGLYRVVLLPPGQYNVTVEAQGFQKETASGVEVNVGRAVDVNFALKVGQISEVIEVSAAIGVDTTRPESGTLVNLQAIQNLPINGRRFHDFITATPTVQVEPQRNQLSFAGQRGINGNISIDGADYNEPFFGGIRGGERANNAFTIPLESIGEFQVVAAGYAAEFGRSTGGIVNAITKSGTNDYHGSAFYQLRHKELTTKDAFGQLSLATQHQFGGSIGGPIKRDRSFFFGAIEDQQFSTPRRVLFSRLVGVTRTPENQEAFDFYKSVEGPFVQTNDAISFIGRNDTQFGPNHRLAVRYNFSDNNAENANATGDAISPLTTRALSNNGTEKDRTHTVVGQFTSIFTPRTINEARLQYSWEQRPRLANELSPNVNTFIGSHGTRNFLPTTLTDWRVQAADALTWNVGSHSAKFGFEWNHVFVNQIFAFNQTGTFNLSGTNADTHLRILSRTPGVATDNRFDDTAVTYVRQIGNGLLEASSDELAFFGQDSWRVRNNFTLYYGLRYEAQFNPTPETNNTDVLNRVKGFPFPLGKVDPGIMPDNTDQVMPRIGFAWDPFKQSRTVVRGNVGIYYARTPLLLMAGPLNNFRLPPGDVSLQLPLRVPAGNPNTTVYRQLLAVGIDLNRFALDKLPIISIEDIQKVAAALGASAPDPFAGANLLSWSPNYRNPRSTQWGFGLEHELPHGLTTGVDFTYVNTVNLQRTRDVNLPVPIVRATDLSKREFFGVRSRVQSRPVSSLGSLWVRESSGHSLYRGFTFRTSMRRSRLQLHGYYTLSWNYSDDDNERSATGQEDTVNVYDLKPEFNYSRLDARHLFTFYSVFSLPWGFEISSTARLQSARPLNPSSGTDSNEDFANNDRPMAAPGVIMKRNSFRNRAVRDVSMRVLKGFNLWGESSRIQLSAEFFNLFNIDNILFGSTTAIFGPGIDPATGNAAPVDPRFRRLRLPDGSFDLTNTPGNPLQVQLGIRLIF